ncbi:DM4/DM12 family domain-containing protein [Phthorimaea operculella]|nr:DM4/DM12 family domain-containing protein [Phthorimaea operculella]
MRSIWVILLFLVMARSKEQDGMNHKWREKRQINSIPLVYPYGATYKLLVGFSLPVPMKEKISLAFAVNFQFQYVQFQNISELSRYYFYNTVSRQQRDYSIRKKRNERLIFYKAFENLLTSKGMSGRECVLQAICEAAQVPVEEEGLFGEIVHILLTPDYGHTPFEDLDPDWKEAIAQYKDAATAGRQMFHCPSIYNGCPEGERVMEMVTKLREE